VRVGGINPDVAVGRDRADFAEHNGKWNWPVELLGQICCNRATVRCPKR
jgi:hypothetical protein